MSATIQGNAGRTGIILTSSMVGTAIEQYDFLLYGAAAALIFDKLFFPSLDPFIGTIAALGTYAAGFLARPLGGLMFGHFGDRIGRRSILMLTLTLMGVASTAIGFLPTYNSIGVWAPLLLVILRIIQGIALGGEQGGAILIAVENAPPNRRGLYGAFCPAGSGLGIVLSFGAMSLAASWSGAEFANWGWRVPFIFSIVLVVIGLIIRSNLRETPVFAQIKERGAQARMPLLELVQKYPRQLFITFGIRLGDIGWATVTVIVTTSYAVMQLGLPKTLVLNAVMMAALIGLVTMPLVGALSDRIGRKPLLYLAGIALAVYAWPYFWLLQTKDPLLVTLAIIVAWGFITPLTYATESAFFAELFETRVRFSGVNAGQQISGILSAGLLPVLSAAALKWTGGDPWPIAAMVVVMAVIILVATALAPETYKRELATVNAQGESANTLPSGAAPQLSA
jgi:MFS transporter, MHS family, shikimate and dehydroshikimate transport protein